MYRCPVRALEYKLRMCLLENKSRGHSCKISLKRGVIQCGLQTKKLGSFLVWPPKNGGHSVCKNAISSQNLQILC